MIVDIGIIALKAFLVVFMVLNLAGILGWVERKGSALIQDRIGANRASIFGFAGMGLVNTLVADPLKFLTKEDFIPAAGDKFLHTLAPCMAFFPALVTFAVIPFGDVLVMGDRVINLQVANINVGILYIFAMASLGVYGTVIGAWASNNKFSLLGGVRGSAQMISYEVAMGLSVIGILMVYGTLELQEIARTQGELLWAGYLDGVSSFSRWRSYFSSWRRLPKRKEFPLTCRKGNRNSSRATTWNIRAASF
jgi:NADH-quinone oxidoreductase subunit H